MSNPSTKKRNPTSDFLYVAPLYEYLENEEQKLMDSLPQVIFDNTGMAHHNTMVGAIGMITNVRHKIIEFIEEQKAQEDF